MLVMPSQMATSGLTAQAYGAKAGQEAVATIIRAMMLGGFIGLTMLALQRPAITPVMIFT